MLCSAIGGAVSDSLCLSGCACPAKVVKAQVEPVVRLFVDFVELVAYCQSEDAWGDNRAVGRLEGNWQALAPTGICSRFASRQGRRSLLEGLGLTFSRGDTILEGSVLCRRAILVCAADVERSAVPRPVVPRIDVCRHGRTDQVAKVRGIVDAVEGCSNGWVAAYIVGSVCAVCHRAQE